MNSFKYPYKIITCTKASSLFRENSFCIQLIAVLIDFLFFIKTESPQTLDFTTLIGATGFEPATSRPPAVRATKLRHTPKQKYYSKYRIENQLFFYFCLKYLFTLLITKYLLQNKAPKSLKLSLALF